MPINQKNLELLAVEYVRDMTSIRGRRVKKFILREFALCVDVSITRAMHEIASFVGVLENGGVQEIKTDGRGSRFAMRIVKGKTVEVRYYSLLRDSLPLLEEEREKS